MSASGILKAFLTALTYLVEVWCNDLHEETNDDDHSPSEVLGSGYMDKTSPYS